MKLTEEQEKKLLALCSDPVAFARVFFDHQLLIKRTPDFHKDIYRSLLTEQRLIVIAPRSFAKSTIVSFLWPLFLALTGRAKRIFIISATGALASEWLRRIKQELETNTDLRAVFGDQVSDKWTEDYIQLKSGVQIVAKGAGYQIRGFRPDYVIVDDIEDDESVRSADQREKLVQWFDSALTNTLEPDSKMAVIGTILHPLSILKRLQTREGWRCLFFQALMTDTDGTQRSLWGEKWTVEALLGRKAEIGTRAFQSEFQNAPVGLENAIVKDEDLRTCDIARPSTFIRSVIVVDPAASKADWADYSAIICVSQTDSGFYRTRYVKRGRWSLLELVKEIFKVSAVYPDARILIEEQAYEKALQDVITKEGRDRGTPIPVGTVRADKDKVRRLERVAHLFEQHLVYFETEDGTLTGDGQALWDELITFPEGEHDDLVDALAYGLSELRYGSGKVFVPSKPLPLQTIPTLNPHQTAAAVFAPRREGGFI